MSFNKTEKFLELARRAAASRQGIRLDDVVSRYEVSFRTAQRMLRALEHQFPNTETWLDGQGRKRWRIPGGQLREFFSVSAEEVAAIELGIAHLNRSGLKLEGKARLAAASSVPTTATTILFVDGFRMDLALRLFELLSKEGLTVNLNWAWSGFPTVTATCKPLVSPVSEMLNGPSATSDVLPLSPDGKPATKSVLFKLMKSNGWETDDHLLPVGKLWTETGRFDEEGHALGARLAERLAAGIRDTADRVLQIVRSGRSVRIVTDHGWLLMPGGLPVAALDVGLVEPNGKRSRCAMVKPKAQTSYLQVPWSWNSEVSIASATGARSFYASYEYAHGGISPQECILPILEVSGAGIQRDVSVAKAVWEGHRLRIEITGGADLRVDLRLGAETSGPSMIKGGRVLDEKGRTSFLVDDEHEREKACLVVLDDDGRVLAQRVVTVGGE